MDFRVVFDRVGIRKDGCFDDIYMFVLFFDERRELFFVFFYDLNKSCSFDFIFNYCFCWLLFVFLNDGWFKCLVCLVIFVLFMLFIVFRCGIRGRCLFNNE